MKITQDHLIISLPYGRDIFKYQLNATFSKKENGWRFPKSIYALEEVARTFPEFAQTEAYRSVQKQLSTQREALKELKNTHTDTDTDTDTDKLRPYQRQDVNYLANIPSAGVFNQPRTGKTPTMIETIKQKKAITSLIVCPASLQHNWMREIEKWHPEAIINHYTAKNRLVQFGSEFAPTYNIVSKDLLKRDLAFFATPPGTYDVLVIDEAHYLRNRDTSQAKAVKAIGTRAKHRYALTGTPTVKHPADIFGILEFLYPKKFSSYWEFINRYFFTTKNHFGTSIDRFNPDREQELKDILDAMSTQRLRKDVMAWLPDKQRHMHTCAMSAAQKKHYTNMLDDFMTACEDSGTEIDTQNALAQLTRLRQITLDPALLKLNAPSAKTEALLEIIADDLYTQPGEPLIIMSMFSGYLRLLKSEIEKLGKRVAMITGEESNAEKDNAAQAFQSGEVDILLCNIISAGTGFTLDRGEVIIFTDKAWNPSDNEQAEDRITPTSQERMHKHFIVSLVCEGTIDEKIEAILERKENLTAIVNQCRSIDRLRTLFYN